MKTRARSILALGFAVMLSACAGSGTRQVASKPPTAAQLQARLLTVDDLAAGWKRGQAINSADLSSVTESIPCPGVTIDRAVARRLKAVTGVQFEPADRSYKHLIELALTGAADRLDKDLRTLFDAMDSCVGQSSASADTSKLTMRRYSVPKLGDQEAVYAITAKESVTSYWHVRNAIVRVGPVAVVFGLTEILAAPNARPQISDAWFQRQLRSAVAKLRG